MSSNNVIGQEASRGEQEVETGDGEFEVVDKTPEMRRSVEQEIQGKVDTNHPDAKPEGLTLEAEERLRARELEIARTRWRVDRREESDREVRSRRTAARGSQERRLDFQRRAASVDPACHPDQTDPRERLTREELRSVNREAARMAERLDGWKQAAISRRVAERVVQGAELSEASIGIFEGLLRMAGQVIPIESVGEVERSEVSVEGEMVKLFEPSHPSIAWVGLLADGTETIKLTVWKRSYQPAICEGDYIRVRHSARSFYNGRPSIAATRKTDITHLKAGSVEDER